MAALRWRRSGQYLLVVWAALTLNFLLPRMAPGDPLDYLIGPEAEILDDGQREAVLAEFGLDRPLPRQYVDYLGGLVVGDLGISLRYGRSVSAILVERIPWTLLILVPSILISTLLATALGTLAASRRGGRADGSLVAVTLMIDSLPAFWIGMVLIAVFAVRLQWLPSFGAVPFDPADGALGQALEIGRRAVLPIATMVIGSLGHTFLLARASVLTALGEDHVLMAHAKGLRPRRVLFGHVLRTALLPVYTSVTLSFGSILGGAVLIETVFAYPGLGRLVFEAVAARDYPLLQGAFVLTALGVIAANWLADATYPRFDPRVRDMSAS